MAKITPQLLKGFRDFGPEEETARQAMFAKASAVFQSFGFLPMSTPVLEYKEVLTGKIGEDEKLIYSFKDNGERDVALRYDLTVPFARYVAQNLNQMTLPFKRSQIGPVWRADKPQKGRYREFFQCDIDVVGSESMLADAEVIACIAKTLEAIGVEDFEIKINNRKILDQAAALLQMEKPEADFFRSLDKIDKLGEAEVNKLLKKLKNFTLDKVKEAWEKSSVDYVASFSGTLQNLGVKNFKFDPFLARGLDYYTGMVFEVVLKKSSGFGSIAGGGRYDSLVDTFSNKAVPAVGGSIGIDRLFDAMSQSGELAKTNPVKALILNLQESLLEDYLNLAAALRNAGVGCELYYETVKLDKQFRYAENKNIKFAIILGDAEKAAGVVKVKNLEAREETELGPEELAGFLTQ